MAMQHIPLIALQLISKVHRTFGVPNSKEEPFTFCCSNKLEHLLKMATKNKI
jgi:hypothetical protein